MSASGLSLAVFISTTEAQLFSVSSKNSDLWEGPTPEVRDFTDFPSLCACSESSLANQIDNFVRGQNNSRAPLRRPSRLLVLKASSFEKVK